jgi:phage repressor protein C with HTH and peptisase S24 domain
MRRGKGPEPKLEDDAAAALSGEPPRLPVATRGDEVELRAVDAESTQLVPVYEGPLGAGEGGNAALVDPAGYMAFRTRWLRSQLGVTPERAFVAQVHGQSMRDLLFHGDLVVGQFGDAPPRQGLCAVVFDGDLLVKTLVSRPGGGIELRSKNPNYETIELTPGEVEADLLHYIGTVGGRVQAV